MRGRPPFEIPLQSPPPIRTKSPRKPPSNRKPPSPRKAPNPRKPPSPRKSPKPVPRPSPSGSTPSTLGRFLNFVPSGLATGVQSYLRIPLADAYSWLVLSDSKAGALQQAAQLQLDLANTNVMAQMWTQYAIAFGKTYGSAQAALVAQQNFQSNLQTVQSINSDTSLHFWTGCNIYCDMDFASFQSNVLMTEQAGGDAAAAATEQPPGVNGPAPGRRLQELWPPIKVDWKAAGKMSPIRDQGSCGSCWAFASTAAIEAAYRIGSGEPGCHSVDLSEQQLVSCVNDPRGYDSQGCKGGWSGEAINYVYKYFQKHETTWPYTGTTDVCYKSRLEDPSPGERVRLSRSYYAAHDVDQAELKSWVAVAPTVIYFCTDKAWHLYSGGVYSSSSCGSCVNHAMVVVGYDITASQPYWLIRNSWGYTWGDLGYAKAAIVRGKGTCGMYQTIIQPSWAFTERLKGYCPPPSPPPPKPPCFMHEIRNCNLNDQVLDNVLTADPISPSPSPSRFGDILDGLGDKIDGGLIFTTPSPSPEPTIFKNVDPADRLGGRLGLRRQLRGGAAGGEAAESHSEAASGGVEGVAEGGGEALERARAVGAEGEDVAWVDEV
ncbi:hypothetical protein HYH03_001549 [Edaphochlamys debaryana]|uniref:Peptidase C1A papain C-terminal domain-containing protein n=1 Tax=Edaphochlamys debaryana TaxID=47281 RepID=A0A836C6K0_9CHLO|nr:hypothetical protein HYH03_001549 [Edaphochlamys debaryana]|eukprot:KAG2500787.1 hypothetical protein HYH03_001549 [Edaphochlamys debaryana]